MRISRYAVYFAGLVFIVSACGVDTGPPEEFVNEPVAHSTADGVTPTFPLPDDSDSEPTLNTVAAVRDHLAASQGVALAQVELKLQEEVIWPNGAIGCPEAGMSYTQALVSGSRVVLSVGDVEYAFHSGRNGVYTYCADPSSPSVGDPDA